MRVRRLLRTVCIAVAAISACNAAQAQGPAAWGYYPWWMRDSWRTLELGSYQRLLFFAEDLLPDGSISKSAEWDVDWRAFNGQCVKRAMPCDIVFLLSGKNDFEHLFADPLLRQLALANIVDEARNAHADGIQLDVEVFESASTEAVAGFGDFVRALRARIDAAPAAQRLLLSAFMTTNGPLLFDAPTAAAIDRLVIQGYDAHWATSANSGPVAILNANAADQALAWPNLLKAALASGLPRERILMAAPYFGYEWPTTSEAPYAATTGAGEETTYAVVSPRAIPRISIAAAPRAQQYGMHRDSVSGSPYYAYQATPGHWRQGWFEDATSLEAKYRFVADQHLGGVAIFAVGYDHGELDPLLKRYFGTTPSYRAN